MRTEVGGFAGDVRAVVVGRLRAREGELVEAIFARVRAGAFAGSGDQDAEYVAGLRAAVAAVVQYGLRGIEHGEDGAGQLPAAALEQARRAARAGVSLDTVLRRYVVGHSLLGEFVMDEADRCERESMPPIPGGAAREALRAQASVLDRLLEAITGEYEDELACSEHSPRRRAAEEVRRLLAGGAVERADLAYDLEGWHLGAIATGTGAAQAIARLATGVDRRVLSVAGDGPESAWAWLGGREPFTIDEVERILAGAGTSAHAAASAAAPPGDPAASGDVVLAFGEPARGVEGWRLTHRQAQAALTVALRSPEQARGVGVTRYAQVALLAFALADEPLARSLVEIFLAPLNDQRDGGAMLRKTLRAYFAAGRNASSAAAALGVARNTIDNRLRTVEQTLGSALSACLAELEVALGLEELGVLAGGEHHP